MWARRVQALLPALGFAVLTGCGSDKSPAESSLDPAGAITAAPASQPATSVAATAPYPVAAIVAESLEWSHDEALANLEDAELGLSAAVRLVRLAHIEAEFLPDPLPPAAAARLRLAPLGDFVFALGLRDDGDARVIRQPLLIDSTGQVTRPGGQDERFDLHVSDNGRIFPHLLIGPMKVASAAQPDTLYLTLAKPPTLRFEIRQNNGYDYLALVRPAGLPAQQEEASSDPAAAAPQAPADKAAPGAPDGGRAADPATPDGARPDGDAPAPAGDADRPSADVFHPSSAPCSAPEAVEVARYTWDPFELTFMGPASDSFPAPLKGRFELDLKNSPWLLPVGGEVGRPDPLRQKPDQPPGDS